MNIKKALLTTGIALGGSLGLVACGSPQPVDVPPMPVTTTPASSPSANTGEVKLSTLADYLQYLHNYAGTAYDSAVTGVKLNSESYDLVISTNLPRKYENAQAAKMLCDVAYGYEKDGGNADAAVKVNDSTGTVFFSKRLFDATCEAR